MSPDGPLKDPLLTVPDVAARLKCSTRTVWRCITDKKVAVVRYGRSVRISEEALQAFILQHCSMGPIESIPGTEQSCPREK